MASKADTEIQATILEAVWEGEEEDIPEAVSITDDRVGLVEAGGIFS